MNRAPLPRQLNGSLPTVAVHDFAFPAGGEVVVATHGRSLWVLDATPLRQITEQVATKLSNCGRYEDNPGLDETTLSNIPIARTS